MIADARTDELNTGGVRCRCSCISQDRTARHDHRAVSKSKCLSKYCKSPSKLVPYVPKIVFSSMYAFVDQNHSYANLRFNKVDLQEDAPEMRVNLDRNSDQVYFRGERLESTNSEAGGGAISQPPATIYTIEELRNFLIEKLRFRLLRSRFFSINEIHKAKNIRVEPDLIAFSTQGVERITLSMAKMGTSQFVTLCNSDKHTSRSIQNYIEASSSENMIHVFKLINSSIDKLIVNPLGNYVLQVAVKRSNLVASELEHYCSRNITRLCSDEYASRVMQTLTEVSSTFRYNVLFWASENLGLLLEALPAVFLLTAAMTVARHPEELACIRDKLLSSSARQYVSYRYFKRILMSFIDKCHFEDISGVCDLYKINKNFHNFLNDKFGAFILIAVIRRGFGSTTKLLLNCIQKDILGLYGTKFFKFVYYRLGRDTELKGPLVDAVLSMGSENVQAATGSRASCFFYCYLIASVAGEELTPLLLQMSETIDDYPQLRDLLLNATQEYKIGNY